MKPRMPQLTRRPLAALQPYRGLIAGGLALVAVVASVQAWTALSALPARHAVLDRQLMQVQGLAAQAAQLRSQAGQGSAVAGAEAEAALQAAVAQGLGGTASLSLQGGTAVLLLQRTPAPQFIDGLERVRQSARVRYSGAKLTLNDGTVSGNVELQLPEVR